VCYCKYLDAVRVNAIVDHDGELPHASSPHIPPYDGVQLGHGTDPHQQLIEPVDIGLPQALFLRFEVVPYFLRITARFWTHDDRQTHGFLDKRANTVSHGSAASGS